MVFSLPCMENRALFRCVESFGFSRTLLPEMEMVMQFGTPGGSWSSNLEECTSLGIAGKSSDLINKVGLRKALLGAYPHICVLTFQ